MSSAAPSADHTAIAVRSVTLAQILGIIVNIVALALAVHWIDLAVGQLATTTERGSFLYQYAPEIHVSIALATVAITTVGLVFAALATTVMTRARTYWWWSAAAGVIICAVATSYFLNVDGRIPSDSGAPSDLPKIASGLAVAAGIIWLAAIEWSLRSGPASGSSAIAGTTEQENLNAVWLRRFYLITGGIVLLCGAASSLTSFILSKTQAPTNGTALPYLGDRITALSLAACAAGLIMLFLARLAGKKSAAFDKAWWLAPLATLLICAYVLTEMVPATSNVNDAASLSTSFLAVILGMSVIVAAFCIVWLVSGCTLQWNFAQKRDSLYAFAATAGALIIMFGTIEYNRPIAKPTSTATAEPQQPAIGGNKSESAAGNVATAAPEPAPSKAATEPEATPPPTSETRTEDERLAELRNAWVALSTSDNQKELSEFITRAQGTTYEKAARYRLEQLQKPAESPAPTAPVATAVPPQSNTRAAELAEAWKIIQDTNSEAVLQEFVGRSDGTIYNGLAQARLDELRAAKKAEAAKLADEQTQADRAAQLAEQQSQEPTISQPATCDTLWHQRNQLFHQHHYCFQQPKALSVFGNIGCSRNQDEAWQAMGEVNRQFINRIRELEKRMRC